MSDPIEYILLTIRDKTPPDSPYYFIDENELHESVKLFDQIRSIYNNDNTKINKFLGATKQYLIDNRIPNFDAFVDKHILSTFYSSVLDMLNNISLSDKKLRKYAIKRALKMDDIHSTVQKYDVIPFTLNIRHPKLNITTFNPNEYTDIDVIYMKGTSSVFTLTNKKTNENVVLKVISCRESDTEFNFAESIYESTLSPNFIKVYERGTINPIKLHDIVTTNSKLKIQDAHHQQSIYETLLATFRAIRDGPNLTKDEFIDKIQLITSDPYVLEVVDRFYDMDRMNNTVVEINKELRDRNTKFGAYIRVHEYFNDGYKQYGDCGKYIVMEKTELLNIGYFLSPKYIKEMNLRKVISIIFILLYIIHLLDSYGLIHGDLFNRNLFLKLVSNLGTKFDYIEYNIARKKFYIDMADMNNYIIKVGDYGRSILLNLNEYNCFNNNPIQIAQYIDQLLAAYKTQADYQILSLQQKQSLDDILSRLKECKPVDVPNFISHNQHLFNILQVQKCGTANLRKCHNITRAL